MKLGDGGELPSYSPDGKLAGAATAVLYLHSGNRVSEMFDSMGVTTDRLFVLLTELKGDVWSIELGQPR